MFRNSIFIYTTLFLVLFAKNLAAQTCPENAPDGWPGSFYFADAAPGTPSRYIDCVYAKADNVGFLTYKTQRFYGPYSLTGPWKPQGRLRTCAYRLQCEFQFAGLLP
jgi:hypothetical protein